jgi:hypothetical protein
MARPCALGARQQPKTRTRRLPLPDAESDQAGFVGQDHGLDHSRSCSLVSRWPTWLLTVASLTNSRVAISALDSPLGDQLKDVPLPVGSPTRASVRREVGGG